MKRKDNQLLVITHLSQLLDLITGIGGFLVPLILWITQKDRVENMDEHGKSILNFRISMFIYFIVCIPLVLLLGLGLVGMLVISIFYLIFPIINAVRASNEEEPYYPMTMEIIK